MSTNESTALLNLVPFQMPNRKRGLDSVPQDSHIEGSRYLASTPESGKRVHEDVANCERDWHPRPKHDDIVQPDYPTFTGATADDLTKDERFYFLAIKIDLEQMVARSESGVKSGEESNTRNSADDEVLDSLWDRIDGKEVALSRDKTLSFILEYLLRLTGAPGVLRLMSSLLQHAADDPQILSQMCSHSCSSHILEAVLDAVARAKAKEGKVSKELSRCLKAFLQAVLSSPAIFLENTYAAHVAEKVLLRLAMVSDVRLAEGAVSYNFVSRVEPASYIGNDDVSNREFRQLLDEMEPDNRTHFSFAVKVFSEFLMTDVGRLSLVCRSPEGTVVVQALIYSRVVLSVLSRTVPEQSDDDFGSFTEMFMSIFEDIASDKYGSRVAEVIVAVCGKKIFENLGERVFSEEKVLDKFVRDHYSHHTVGRLFTSCSSAAFLLRMCKYISTNLLSVLESAHGMLLVRLAQKLTDPVEKTRLCKTAQDEEDWGQCQRALTSGLDIVYRPFIPASWKSLDKSTAFLLCVGALYPRNIKDEVQKTVENTCMPGSQIQQAMCSFEDVSVITQGIWKMDGELLTKLCCHPCGNHTLEALLQIQCNRKSFHPFFKKLLDILPHLVLDKHGSRVFDSLWKIVDLKSRESIAEALLPVESAMKANDYGRFLLPKLDLGLYRRSIEAWRKEQHKYQDQKDELDSILSLFNKKTKR